tara:strand:+ start:314 stop:988 length:675 start_codon:yes stop_codon:yes gene_type:complete
MISELQKRILSSIFLIPIAIFFIIKGSIFFNFFLFIFFIASSYEWLKMNIKKVIKYAGFFYLIFTFFFAYFLRNDYGPHVFIFVIIICVSTDIGGYIFGKLLKGPKLTKISPNKTYAGVIGSFVFSIILGFFYLNYYNTFLSSDNTYEILQSVLMNNDLHFLITIFIISSISQLGDLIISYFKRIAKIKNTGKILPGHGGLLDRIDGIVFAIPSSYLLFYYFII